MLILLKCSDEEGIIVPKIGFHQIVYFSDASRRHGQKIK